MEYNYYVIQGLTLHWTKYWSSINGEDYNNSRQQDLRRHNLVPHHTGQNYVVQKKKHRYPVMSQQLIMEGKVELLYQTAKHDTTIFSPDHELCVHFLVP